MSTATVTKINFIYAFFVCLPSETALMLGPSVACLLHCLASFIQVNVAFAQLFFKGSPFVPLGHAARTCKVIFTCKARAIWHTLWNIFSLVLVYVFVFGRAQHE